MMSQRAIRATKQTVWIIGVLFSASIGVAAAITPDTHFTIIGMGGTTSVTFSAEWVFGACFILTAGVLKYLNDKLSKMEDSVHAHEARLAAGAEQLKLIREMNTKLSYIAEHGCARVCGSQPATPQTTPVQPPHQP